MKQFFFWILLLQVSLFFAQKDSCTICFTIPEGIYENPITISVIPKDSIDFYYTTDGSLPSSKSDKLDTLLTLKQPTSIRVVAYKNGKRIARATNSYIIGRKFDLPVVSITVEPDDFFGYERGIYVKGCCASEDPPYNGANFWKGWERKVNVTFFDIDGTVGFNQQAGAKIFGGFSKSLPMKSISLTSRKKYGQKYFKYPIFPNLEIKKYKSVVLRNSGGDFNKTHFRDALLTNLVEPLDLEIQAYRPVVVFINGEYWGIHNLREKITEHYLKAHFNIDPNHVDIMKHRNDLQHGSRKQYKALLQFLRNNDFSDTAKVRVLNQMMDIDNYINYNITEVFIDNRDAGGNIRYWKPQNDSSKWRWILFDTDMSFGISDWKGYKTNTLKKMTSKNEETWPDPAWSTFIIRKLLENDSLKEVYINRFSDHLNTIFSSENVLYKLDSIKAMLNNEMPYHVERWKSNNIKRWERNVQILRDFATYRPSYVRKHLMEKFGLTDTVLLRIKGVDAKKGEIYLNSLELTKDFEGYYFDSIPVRLKAIPNIGYKFVKWKGFEDTTPEIKIILSKDTEITPVFEKRERSPFSTKVVLNEFCVKSDTINPTKDWIEIYNNTDTTIDITNWSILVERKRMVLKEPKILHPHEYYVIARRPSLLGLPTSLDSLPRGLPSKKGFVALLDAELNFVDSLTYNTKANFKKDTLYLPIILERVNPSISTPIANWNINNKPSMGKRNRAYKIYKPRKLSYFEKNKKNILLASIGGVLALLFVILLIIWIKHQRKIG